MQKDWNVESNDKELLNADKKRLKLADKTYDVECENGERPRLGGDAPAECFHHRHRELF